MTLFRSNRNFQKNYFKLIISLIFIFKTSLSYSVEIPNEILSIITTKDYINFIIQSSAEGTYLNFLNADNPQYKDINVVLGLNAKIKNKYIIASLNKNSDSTFKVLNISQESRLGEIGARRLQLSLQLRSLFASKKYAHFIQDLYDKLEAQGKSYTISLHVESIDDEKITFELSSNIQTDEIYITTARIGHFIADIESKIINTSNPSESEKFFEVKNILKGKTDTTKLQPTTRLLPGNTKLALWSTNANLDPDLVKKLDEIVHQMPDLVKLLPTSIFAPSIPSIDPSILIYEVDNSVRNTFIEKALSIRGLKVESLKNIIETASLNMSVSSDKISSLVSLTEESSSEYPLSSQFKNGLLLIKELESLRALGSKYIDSLSEELRDKIANQLLYLTKIAASIYSQLISEKFNNDVSEYERKSHNSTYNPTDEDFKRAVKNVKDNFSYFDNLQEPSGIFRNFVSQLINTIYFLNTPLTHKRILEIISYAHYAGLSTVTATPEIQKRVFKEWLQSIEETMSALHNFYTNSTVPTSHATLTQRESSVREITYTMLPNDRTQISIDKNNTDSSITPHILYPLLLLILSNSDIKDELMADFINMILNAEQTLNKINQIQSNTDMENMRKKQIEAQETIDILVNLETLPELFYNVPNLHQHQIIETVIEITTLLLQKVKTDTLYKTVLEHAFQLSANLYKNSHIQNLKSNPELLLKLHGLSITIQNEFHAHLLRLSKSLKSCAQALADQNENNKQNKSK